MFCYQCEQTAKGSGCDKSGVCGKQPDVAAIQDLLVYALKGLSVVALAARRAGIVDSQINVFTTAVLFATLTNVNFDAESLADMVRQCVKYRDSLKDRLTAKGETLNLTDAAVTLIPAVSINGMIAQGESVGILSDPDLGPDIRSLQQLMVYGIKGIAAYAYHAQLLGHEDDTVYTFCQEGLAATLSRSMGLDDWLGMVLQCGAINLRAMELLDAGHTNAYGHPVPTKVPLGVKRGKAILVSGHDLKDLYELLRLTEGKGIQIYTHGEMLPAHGYPQLKQFSHLFGHYGTAWQNQHKEFTEFPGAILMTTNCLQKPMDRYRGNLFTTGVVGWPGVSHVTGGAFGPVVEKSLAMPGFTADREGGFVTTGFGRHAVLAIADAVIEAVKTGKVRHFFLVRGCDGAKAGRSYYTEFVEKVPRDCVVLTLACGKFRFFDRDMGDIGGIPRLIDIGQCNDAYSAIQIATALAKAFNTGVNSLPLSMILSWYEQKAVAILLTLLYLGIKNIRLGPSLPAFISPAVLDVLVKAYGIRPITTPEEDLKAILG